MEQKAVMKLVLSFVHPTKPARIVGPFNSLRLDGDSIRELGNDRFVAYHRERLWEVEGEKYFRLDATSRVRVQFERSRPDPYARSRSRDFGPFEPSPPPSPALSVPGRMPSSSTLPVPSASARTSRASSGIAVAGPAE